MYRAAFIILFALGVSAQTAGNWTRQIPSSFPLGRAGASMVYDSVREQVVLFGGNNSGVKFNDTWVWDGNNWAQKSPANSPSGRTDFAMAFDAARGQVVMFGGQTALAGGTVVDETWVWDGTNWTQKSPANSPGIRSGTQMVYDAARKQVVLFGGNREAAIFEVLGDTWIWDGSNWAQQKPANNPAARYKHVMGYDAARSQVVLFSGMSNPMTFTDTWVWDGSNWTQKLTPVAPPPRYQSAMAFDSLRGKLLLFGGHIYDPGQNDFDANDTWLWDGAAWSAQSPQTSPQARYDYAMAYDAGNDQILLFGGEPGFYFGDTWTWNGGSIGAGGPSITAVINASGFGGSASVAPASWVEIYGAGLSGTTRQWGGADFKGNNAPTSLDGVAVTIGGQNAFVDYVSATQVNAQLPSGIATGGSLPVVVTNNSVASAAVSVPVKATSPGLLAPASFLVGGKQYIVALLPDGVTYILPPGAIAGLPARRAKPGDTIILYGIGFGGVMPDIPAGQIVTGQNQLAQSLQVSIGGTPAQTPYFGLAPGYVGLYQFNVVVPQVPDNDLTAVTFSLGGVPGTQTLYIAVHQ